METITNSELSKKLNIPHTKIKRWTREFLPFDPMAKKQSGYTRKLSHNEAFMVYMGGHLLNGHNFSIYEAKIIMNDLKEWLENKGLMPEPPDFNPRNRDKDVINYNINIIVKEDSEEFWYEVIGEIENALEKMVGEKEYRRKKYVSYYIKRSTVEFLKAFSSEERNPISGSVGSRRFLVELLLRDYLFKVKGKEATSKYYEERGIK